MSAVHSVVLGFALLLSATDPLVPPGVDPARLRELLHDPQNPRSQSQAALLLVQNPSPDADAIIRQGLRQTQAPETFRALASALRLSRDARFRDELLAALTAGSPLIREAAAGALAELTDGNLVVRLKGLIEDTKIELAVRQTAVGILGRSGCKAAVVILLQQLATDDETLRQAAAEALTELTGQMYGMDLVCWRQWWERQKDLSNERWLEERLAYRVSRARRLEADLERTRDQVVRLHQQLYGRLPTADRLGHVQTLADHDDASVRLLAVNWSVELLPVAEGVGQKALLDLVLRLSHDGAPEVQRAAVLALGRVNDPQAFERLHLLLQQGAAPVRAAAARALAQQARGSGPEALARQRQVVPALQKALDDPALEVVVEAAEDLGALGVPEAAPVLLVLLRHPSKPVRQIAAQALERVADLTVLDGLLEVLDDPAATVRFSLVGALGHAAGEGRTLTEGQQARLLARLEGILLRDADPGVRSRAATVLGECGRPVVLPLLWRRVLAAEDSRVQEKAWLAVVEILVHSTNLELLRDWDHIVAEAKQGPRRLQLWSEVYGRWQKREETKPLAALAVETLVQVQLEQGKWAAALPLVRELLARPGKDAELDNRLRWLWTVGEQALKEGNRPETLRVVQEAQPFLSRRRNWAEEFEKLQEQAGKLEDRR